MFVPPEQRGSWVPPRPDDERSKRSENVLLILVGVFLFSLLLAPIGGGTVVQAIVALLAR